MKILVVSPLYHPNRSGSAIHMAKIAEGLAADGADVTVWTTDVWDTHYFVERRMRNVRVKEEEINRVNVKRFPLSSMAMSHPEAFGRAKKIWPPWSVWALRDPATHSSLIFHSLIGTERFDLVIAGVLPHTPFLIAGLITARKWRVPLVFMSLIHTGEPSRVEYRQEFLGNGVPTLLSNADLVVCNTEVESNLLQARGIGLEKLMAIGPGADPQACLGGDGARFRQKYGIKGHIVLQIGTQTHEKGSHHTAEAVSWLRIKGLDVTAVFLGFVRDDFDEGYLAHKSPHGIEGVMVLGEVDDSTKRDALAAAQIVSMPSNADSFGIAFLEGWLAGLPALGTFSGGIPYAIDDGVDGFLVPFGDWHAAAEYMEILIEKPELAAKMGAAGRKKVWERYTWDKVLQRFKQAVYSLVQKQMQP